MPQWIPYFYSCCEICLPEYSSLFHSVSPFCYVLDSYCWFCTFGSSRINYTSEMHTARRKRPNVECTVHLMNHNVSHRRDECATVSRPIWRTQLIGSVWCSARFVSRFKWVTDSSGMAIEMCAMRMHLLNICGMLYTSMLDSIVYRLSYSVHIFLWFCVACLMNTSTKYHFFCRSMPCMQESSTLTLKPVHVHSFQHDPSCMIFIPDTHTSKFMVSCPLDCVFLSVICRISSIYLLCSTGFHLHVTWIGIFFFHSKMRRCFSLHRYIDKTQKDDHCTIMFKDYNCCISQI